MTKTASEPSTPRWNVFHILLVVPWIALVVNAFAPIDDNSYLWHIRAGELQLEAAEVMTADVFSFTVAGEAWRTQSWLVELLYGWLESATGLTYTAPMVVLVSVICFLSLGAIAYRHSKSVAATAAVLLLSAVIVPRFLVPRPVLFTYLLFPLVVLAWERLSNRWVVPFLFWLWASIHGAFVIGLLYIGLRILQQRDWRGLRPLLVAGVACLTTAHGFGVIEMLLEFFEAREFLRFIMEWATPDLLEWTLLPMVVALILVVHGATRGRVQGGDLWILAPFLMVALSSQRSVGMAWVALAPLVSRSIGPLHPTWVRGLGRPAAAVAATVVLALPLLFAKPPVLDNERFPVAAATELEDVNTFHDDSAGGFLIWEKGPEFQVFIDDRVELYDERIEEFFNIRTRQEDWHPVFTRDEIQQALLSTGEPLVGELTEDGWIVEHEDPEFTVLSRP